MSDLQLDHLYEARSAIGAYLEACNDGSLADGNPAASEMMLYAIASALTSIAGSLAADGSPMSLIASPKDALASALRPGRRPQRGLAGAGFERNTPMSDMSDINVRHTQRTRKTPR